MISLEQHAKIEVANQYSCLVTKYKQELSALANDTIDVLNQLNISIESLPQKCQLLLNQISQEHKELDVNLDPTSISLRHSKELYEKLEDEYEILKLKQKNIELQGKIDRNNKFIEDLKKEIVNSKQSLMERNPSPENIHDYIRQLKQKVVSYEESCEKARMKFTKIGVPETIYPKSITGLISSLTALKMEESSLQQRAEEIILVREAKDNFNKLRRQE